MKQNNSNSILRNVGGNTTKREIKELKGISKRDQQGIIRLYDALVPQTTRRIIDVEFVRKYFPTFEEVNIPLIVEEGFPMFEKTIGSQNFEKVKRYFGIGQKKFRLIKSNKEDQEIATLISCLRTIENAQYYITGYKDLISKMARKLEGAPESLTDLEKAKLVRMYILIYCGGYYFVQDYSYTGKNLINIEIDEQKVYANNKELLYPEELFIQYLTQAKSMPDENIFYDFISEETLMLDKKTLKEFLKVAELELNEEEQFISVNNAYVDLTFGMVRNIKFKVYQEPNKNPIDIFSSKSGMNELEFKEVYWLYKLLKIFDLSEFDTVEKPYKRFEGSRLISTTYPCFEIIKGIYVSGEIEKQRIIRFVEYIAHRGFSMESKYDFNHIKLEKTCTYNVKHFMGAIKFANDAEYLSAASLIEKDFEVATLLIERDKTNALEEYFDADEYVISLEEMKERLSIDENFEFEYFGIKKEVNLPQVIVNFAMECGYVETEEEVNYSIIEAVIIPDNEEIIEKYHNKEINADEFAKKIGFTHEFGEMFFNLSKIDMAAIEAKLLEVKKLTVGKKKINHNLKLLVLLYCYIVEEQIACGPKMRVPKRNKALKTSNLRMFIS